MLILTAVMFIQFKTVKQTDFTSLENMREDELRTGITNFKQKTEETNKRLEEVNAKIAEYEQTIESNTEASEVLAKELENIAKMPDIKRDEPLFIRPDVGLNLYLYEDTQAGAEDNTIAYKTMGFKIIGRINTIKKQTWASSSYWGAF